MPWYFPSFLSFRKRTIFQSLPLDLQPNPRHLRLPRHFLPRALGLLVQAPALGVHALTHALQLRSVNLGRGTWAPREQTEVARNRWMFSKEGYHSSPMPAKKRNGPLFSNSVLNLQILRPTQSGYSRSEHGDPSGPVFEVILNNFATLLPRGLTFAPAHPRGPQDFRLHGRFSNWIQNVRAAPDPASVVRCGARGRSQYIPFLAGDLRPK